MLPRTNPIAFCKAYISRELEEYREDHIWMSCWPIMERMIERADELSTAFSELVKAFGYQDNRQIYAIEESYLGLTLEHIWQSKDYQRDEISKARETRNELKRLNKDIIDLTTKLERALLEQDDIYEKSSFQKDEYQHSYDVLLMAGKKNTLFDLYLGSKLKSLAGQFDLKYWPSRSDLIAVIKEFEKNQPSPQHMEFPTSILNGRTSIFKDFIIAFDQQFRCNNGLPDDFQFSNTAMSEVLNIVLDLPPENIASPDAVKLVRNRYCNNVDIL